MSEFFFNLFSSNKPFTKEQLKGIEVGGHTLKPIVGKVTRDYIRTFGISNDPINTVNRQATMIADGVWAINSGYRTNMEYGFIQMSAPDTVYSGTMPSVGLKIHVFLDPKEADYADKLLKIAGLCVEGNSEGRSTSLKVMSYVYAIKEAQWYPNQSKKTISIYPNYLGGGKTNVPETVRLVRGLRKILGDNLDDGQTIYKEHKAGKGVFLAAGALKHSGRAYEKADVTAPFDEMVEKNLNKPPVDAALFKQQIVEAIGSGDL